MEDLAAESDLIRRLEIAEARLAALETKINDPVERIKRDLANRKVYSSSFARVPGNYYDSPLSKRASILKCTVPQLCKSIIFENTAWSDDGSNDRTNGRFYLVVVQYQGAPIV
jgi:hypothetical protein